jgi:hypothetical protein
MKNKKKLEKKCEEFFQSLIKKTGTYFLSDYVETFGEFPTGSVTKKEHKKIVEKRDELRMECKKLGVDFHGISCDVANEFFEKNAELRM